MGTLIETGDQEIGEPIFLRVGEEHSWQGVCCSPPCYCHANRTPHSLLCTLAGHSLAASHSERGEYIFILIKERERKQIGDHFGIHCRRGPPRAVQFARGSMQPSHPTQRLHKQTPRPHHLPSVYCTFTPTVILTPTLESEDSTILCLWKRNDVARCG
jgi:hypothetical protein